MSEFGIDRRQFVKAVGAAGAAALFAGEGAAAPGEVSTRVLDRQFDTDGGLQEALVVFDDAASAGRLETLDLAEGYHVFETLGIAHTFLDPDQLGTVADWEAVRRVKRAEELTFYNDGESRTSMAVDAVHEDLGYDGEDTHVVVIDTGIDASHPALQGGVEANYQYVDDPFGERDALWVDAAAADTDEFGHGTHCAGIVGADGTGGVQGDYTGMAPAATITGYSTTQYQYLPYVVAAWEHMLSRAQTDPGFDPDVVSNSYGVARGMPYNPNDPVNVASWRAVEMGILPVFAMGNDYELGTGNRFAKAPHVLGVAAAGKTIDEADNRNDRPIADFSSRGREYDPEKADAEPENYVADRVYHDRERMLENLRAFHAIQDGTHDTVDTGEMTGRFGAGVNGDPVFVEEEADTGSSYEQLQTFENVDLVDLTLSIEPDGQWVRVTVYDDEGDEVAMMGEEVVHQHRTLTFDVDGGQSYAVEIEPEDGAGGSYTLAYTQYEKADGELADARPFTLYRPGISTHGVSVMSTMDKYDVLAPLEASYGGNYSEPFYARLSGTSMACPAAAGVAALVVQAYRAAHADGVSPDPLDVIRVLEHTAADHNPTYTPANTGAGFVDARAAVETAEALGRGDLAVGDLETGLDALVEPPEPDLQPALSAAGDRADDGTAFTAGQTDRVEVTVSDLAFEEADDLPVSDDTEVKVHDVVPGSWTVYETGDADEGAEQRDDGTKHVPLGTVTPADLSGDATETFVYYARAPDESGAYTFGPAGAHVTVEADGEAVTLASDFGGTETNYVVGQSTALQ